MIWYEKKKEKGWFTSDKKISWEEWVITVQVKPNKEGKYHCFSCQIFSFPSLSLFFFSRLYFAYLIAVATISEQRKEVLEQELRNRVVTILKLVNENKNHIPPLTSKETLPFPYEVRCLLSRSGFPF